MGKKYTNYFCQESGVVWSWSSKYNFHIKDLLQNQGHFWHQRLLNNMSTLKGGRIFRFWVNLSIFTLSLTFFHVANLTHIYQLNHQYLGFGVTVNVTQRTVSNHTLTCDKQINHAKLSANPIRCYSKMTWFPNNNFNLSYL